MRDNLIAVESFIDEYGLCADLCSSIEGTAGILVWKDPWDPTGWEVTSSFASVWGLAIKDCWDLFRSTNYWRLKRGEKPLFRIPSVAYTPRETQVTSNFNIWPFRNEPL